MEGVRVKVATGVRKTKKKKVKDEFDRIKQAEKKKRRLEKALATSASIRAELEKKKQKKKEQERLDEEGAAIAEAVALHVLLSEDSDDSMVKKEGQTLCDYGQQHLGYRRLDQPHENLGWSVHTWPYESLWGSSNCMASSHPFSRDVFCPRYVLEEDWGSVGISADHLAALQIADDAYAFNRSLRG